ncbi:MAG: DUF222 domain-containing protein [Nocardioidaceae bacterium]
MSTTIDGHPEVVEELAPHPTGVEERAKGSVSKQIGPTVDARGADRTDKRDAPAVDMTDSVAAPLQRVVSDALAGLAGAPLWRLSDAEAVAALDAAYRKVTQAHAVALRLLGAVDGRGLPVAHGATCTQAWLTARRRVRPGDAKRDVELARLLTRAADATPDPAGIGDTETDPVEGSWLAAGVHAGAVNVEQAGCIATALSELPVETDVDARVVAERVLVDQASDHGPATLARLGHRILDVIDPDEADRRLGAVLDREERQATRLRSATRFSDGHGSVFYKLRIPLADDTVIYPVLDALAAPDPAGPAGADTRTPHQRLADAFVETFRRVTLDGDLPQSGGDRPRIVITMDLNHLQAGIGAGTILDTGDQLSVSAVRRLACDAQLIPAVLNGPGQLLDLGRARRTFDGPARLAVTLRDRGCIHPGCDRPARWCDVHHVIPWWHGGRTDLTNGVLLCGTHHKLYDHNTWQIRFTPDHIPESIPPPWLDAQRKPIRHTRHLHRRRP